MTTRAAITFAADKPLVVEEVDLDGPRAGEVLVEIMATGVCHTDAYTLSGMDSEGRFPSILGHEGAGIVREVALRAKREVGRPRGHYTIKTSEDRRCFRPGRRVSVCRAGQANWKITV